ncbi:regulatory protein RecX [Budvicia diplopodorum]|uniref:regulatory protein RecX n=1 Tax=Budvicia diplopodorum TaxID=1119056 RepID=UPI001358FA4B|nr:regulatory protein RecX [Budvicia diplopodorum]
MNSLLPRAMRLLSQRDYSEQEMRRKLAAHSPFDRTTEKIPVSQESIDNVIEYCYQHSWLNDVQFTQRFIVSRSRKGYGPQRIQSELQQKGIGRDEVRRALSESDVDWFEMAKDLAIRRFGSPLPADWKAKSKVQRYLSYRGFTQDEIQYVFTDCE